MTMSKNSTAVLRVGQTITLNQQKGELIGLRKYANKDSSIVYALAQPKVIVEEISFGRRDLGFNHVWIKVTDAKDPSNAQKCGWISYDPGGWALNKRLKIGVLLLVDK